MSSLCECNNIPATVPSQPPTGVWAATKLVAAVPGRVAQLVAAAWAVFQVWRVDPDDERAWSKEGCAQVQKLGGLVAKVAQQAMQMPDMVKSKIVKEMFEPLQSRNEARPLSEIEDQLKRAFPRSEIRVEKELGAGCMAEAHAVTISGVVCENCQKQVKDVKFVAKTANSKQQELFEVDFKVFATLVSFMRPVVAAIRLVQQSSADEIQAVLDKVQTMACNPDLVKSVRNGFRMDVEGEQTRRGAKVLRTGPCCKQFCALSGCVASPKGDVLLMPQVQGELVEKFKDPAGGSTIATTLPFFVFKFICTYVHMIWNGLIHMDMHPGNLMVPPCRSMLVVIDWGEVVDVPRQQLKDVQALFKYVVTRKGFDTTSDTLQQLLQRLGVQPKPGTSVNPENYEALALMLDIRQALKGDQETSTDLLIKANVFTAPGWFEAWQKASNAVVASLQAAGATAEEVDEMLKSAVQDSSHTGSDRARSRSPRR